MKRLAIALVLVAGCSSPSPAPTQEPQKPPPARETVRKGVLVLAFTDESGMGKGDVGGYAADQVIAALTATGSYRVIDRAQVAKTLEELKHTGPVDAGKLGQLFGVDYVVFGSLHSLGARVESEESPGGEVKTQIAECRLTIKVMAVGKSELAGALPGKGSARRSAKAPARMSYDPTLTYESVQNAIEDAKGSLLPVLK